MKYLFFVSAILWTLGLSAQTSESTYSVIQLNGQIFNVTQSADLMQGNSFEGQDKLNFKQKSYAYVISDERKKYMLRTVSIESDDADIFSNAELALSPIRSRGQLSTRGAVSESGVKDLKSYFGIENFNVLGDQLQIPMDGNVYPLNDKEFIVFYYTINGKKVSKKVGFNAQVLNIEKEKLKESKAEILAADTIQELSVYKYEPSTGNSELITEINLCFIAPDRLKKELLTIVPILKKQAMSTKEIKDYLKQYVVDIYGNMDDTQLNTLISSIAIE